MAAPALAGRMGICGVRPPRTTAKTSAGDSAPSRVRNRVGEPWREAGDEGRGAGVVGRTKRAEELSGLPLPWCSCAGVGGRTHNPSVAVAGNDCETFWDKDQLTDSCYQFNFQSTLSWREAWASCEQQGADLLSITEIHEQTYINGEAEGSLLWLSQKSGPCWGWGDTSSRRSAPAPTTRQDLDSSVGGPRKAFISL